MSDQDLLLDSIALARCFIPSEPDEVAYAALVGDLTEEQVHALLRLTAAYAASMVKHLIRQVTDMDEDLVEDAAAGVIQTSTEAVFKMQAEDDDLDFED